MRYIGMILALVILTACTEVFVNPVEQNSSQVISSVTGPSPLPVPETPEPSDTNRLTFTSGPPDEVVLESITINLGTPVTVKVIARDASGQEVPSEDLTATIRDSSVATVKEISGRFVTFSGVAAGETEATIRANGLAKSLPIKVQ